MGPGEVASDASGGHRAKSVRACLPIDSRRIPRQVAYGVASLPANSRSARNQVARSTAHMRELFGVRSMGSPLAPRSCTRLSRTQLNHNDTALCALSPGRLGRREFPAFIHSKFYWSRGEKMRSRFTLFCTFMCEKLLSSNLRVVRSNRSGRAEYSIDERDQCVTNEGEVLS